MRESLEKKKKRASAILARLKKAYPEAGIALKYKTPMQLLTAVILSAQATDVQVNKITAELFSARGGSQPKADKPMAGAKISGGKKYKTVDDFASADLRVFTKEISSINFYKNKARFILQSARMIRDDYNGRMPDDIDELVKLPGVARKTANIVLWNVYHKAQGIAVDTHVKRVAKNLGLTDQSDPVKIERDLMELYPKHEWGVVSYYFQAYGRTAMPARGKPKMEDSLKGLYPVRD